MCVCMLVYVSMYACVCVHAYGYVSCLYTCVHACVCMCVPTPVPHHRIPSHISVRLQSLPPKTEGIKNKRDLPMLAFDNSEER